MAEPRELSTYYRAGGQREFDRNTVQGLRKSVSHCHDVNQAIIRVRSDEERQQRRTDRWLRRGVIVANLIGAVLSVIMVLQRLMK